MVRLLGEQLPHINRMTLRHSSGLTKAAEDALLPTMDRCRASRKMTERLVFSCAAQTANGRPISPICHRRAGMALWSESSSVARVGENQTVQSTVVPLRPLPYRNTHCRVDHNEHPTLKEGYNPMRAVSTLDDFGIGGHLGRLNRTALPLTHRLSRLENWSPTHLGVVFFLLAQSNFMAPAVD